MVGENIKKIRTEKGMTQKALADLLYVTPQAVSRWENGEVEPSVSTVLEIAKIFQVTTDELLGTPIAEAEPQKEETKEEPKKQEEPHEQQKETPPPPKQMLALCEGCNRPIYESSDIHRESYSYGSSGHGHRIYCTACYKRKLVSAQRAKVQRAAKCRIRGYVLGALFFLVALIIGIVNNNSLPDEGHLTAGIVVAIGGFCLIDCWCLNNNFVGDMVMDILSWGFVKFPGIIFSFDIDGCLFLIAMKILFKVLGLLISIVLGLFAFCIGSVVSPFVLPFALVKSYKHPEETDDF